MEESKNILIRQNEPENLRYQIVAGECYKRGKILSYCVLICSVLVPVLFSVAQKFLKDDTIVASLCILYFWVWCVNLILRNQLARYKYYGACFQQIFDKNVLKINDTVNDFISSQIIQTEQRLKLMKKYSNKKRAPKEDWYNDYSSLPYNKAVFYCQKENIRWDLDLRKRYQYLLLSLAVISIGLILLFAILTHKSVATMILSFASGLTVLEFFLNSYFKLNKDINTQLNLKRITDEIESDIDNDSALWSKIEMVQYKIFDYRKKAYLIPDWFYKIFRKKDQEVSDMFAEELRNKKKEAHDEQNDKKAD